MKYYYTDPLAAEWVSEHFRVKFSNGDSSISACEVPKGGKIIDTLFKIKLFY